MKEAELNKNGKGELAMAKQDYSKDVGMWSIQPVPNSQTGGDTTLNTLIPEFEKVWDGHSTPTKRACNVLMTYGNANTWGYTDSNRYKRNAYAFGAWMLRVKAANASSGGAGAPRYLAGIVFRPMWNLLYAIETPSWTPQKIRDMAGWFLDYFISPGSSRPEYPNGVYLTNADLSLLRGYFLGDDFAKWGGGYNSQWDSIVDLVHSAQQARSINRPFYFTNQIFDARIWNNGAPYGQRFNGLKQWLDVFSSTGATPIFMPQFYPWEDGTWNYHDERDGYVWWNVALDELLYLKNNDYPSLRVQPVIQACASEKAGPGHPDIHNQLRAVLDHSVVEAVWLLGWNNNVKANGWTCYKSTDNRWTDKQQIAEAIQVEIGGSAEAIISSVSNPGMNSADPTSFYRQTSRNQGSGYVGTRLNFTVFPRQPIRIKIDGPISRLQLDGFIWSGRLYSFDGSWNEAQYTRNPRLNPDDPSLEPLHGTSVNWNGWTEQDAGQAPTGNYDVRLQDISGNGIGNPITVKTQ